MIQPLPFAQRNRIEKVFNNINENQSKLSTGEWSELPNEVFSQARIIEEYTIETESGCSKEMFFGFLMSVETESLKQSIQINKAEELECGICGRKYLFNRDELKAIVKVKDGV